MSNVVSPNVNYVLSKVISNSIKGCFWGFVNYKDIEDIKQEVDNNDNIMIIKKGNVCICEVDPNYLVTTANDLQPNMYTSKDLEIIQQRAADAVVEFEKFLITKGQEKENFAGTIGIYCLNSNPTMVYNGVNYPAFRLNMVKVLQLLDEYGYCVKCGKDYIDISKAIKDKNILWGSVMVAPMLNGVFINIKCRLSISEMKQKETYFKKKYSIS